MSVEEARSNWLEAQSDLAEVLDAECARGQRARVAPHHYVQHRDKRPPWCPQCGYTRDGQQVRA